VADTAPQTPRVVKLSPEPLTREAFAEFGTVVGPEKFVLTSTEFPFFTNLATLEPDHLPITYVNRHHDHHQIFATFDGKPMIVVVASPRLSGAEIRPEDVRAFVTDGNTAIVFHVDTWHLAPRAVGPTAIRALNVQATNNHVHTERVDLAPTFGCVIELDVPRKETLLRRIRESRASLEQVVARLSAEQLTAAGPDGWAVKDHLAHVAAWEESLLALLDGRDRNQAVGLSAAESVSANHDTDAINAVIYRRHRDRSASDVLATFHETHARVLAALDRLTDADLLRPYSHYQPNAQPLDPRPVLGWIEGNTWDHYDEHAAWIRALVEQST
jgi:ureidoglycolate hydrolase